MIKLVVAGETSRETVPGDLVHRLPDGVVCVQHSIALRADRAGAEEHELLVNDDDIIELTLSEGRRRWVRADELETALSGTVDRSASAGSGVIRIPSAIAMGSHQRGVGKWVVEGLRVLGVDLAGSITDIVSKRVEGTLHPAPGLYRMHRKNIDDLVPAGGLDFSRPILLFLHGTGSTTAGSFGDLWAASGETAARLFDKYGDQVLAFQHRTLSHSPVENALELVSELLKLHGGGSPRVSMQLDLVSHSRGGLVGEVLCRGTAIARRAFDADDHRLFAEAAYQRDGKALIELDNLMSQIDLVISRFIRVACPARGTTLAGGRLDSWLSGMVNVLGETTGLANGVVYDSISTLMLGVVKKRTQPQELPGLEAMMPGSPTVRMLNRPDIQLAADLHVLGGDIAAAGVWQRLKVFLTDLYYQEDHDLIVNTPAMLGGGKRVDDIHYWIDTGEKVNHFLYFSNTATVSRLEAALLKPDDSAFRVLTTAPHAVTAKDYRKRAGEPQPIVFVLPGIMGSHLACNGKRIWLDYLQVAGGGITRLGHKATDVLPDGPVEDVYAELMDHLSVTHEVRPFAYDWRKPVKESAELLATEISAALDSAESHDMPVRIVAHSMGGLVARAMIGSETGKKVWERMCRLPGCRLVMLGTPNRGSHAMANLMIGRDSLLRKLAWLDMRNDYAALQETIIDFEGVLELLPHDGSLDLFDADDWQKLHSLDTTDRIERPDQRGIFGSSVDGSKSSGVHWKLPDTERLANAAELKDILTKSPVDARYMIYIAGTAPATADDMVLDLEAAPGFKVRVSATSEGDGRVTWASGIPDELRKHNLYYLDVPHGDLASTRDAFPAIQDLLSAGHTDRLSRTPPERRGIGSMGDSIVLPEPVELYPDREAILSAAIGGRSAIRPVRGDKVKVRMIHGNLARSEHPVLVGHYEGDTIVSAENYLDRQLNGRLRQRHALGLYPAKLGSSAVILNSPSRVGRGEHPGAIVVGLGTFGDLTPGQLTTTLARGVMQYAVTMIEEAAEHGRTDPESLPTLVSVPLSALLVGGSSDTGVSESLQSILSAVRLVNQQLEMAAVDVKDDGVQGQPLARVDKVDIIELWEDKAVQATRALRRVCARQTMKNYFDVEPLLVENPDGCRRASFDDREGWWARMRVTVDESDNLKFETFAERARVDSHLQPTQRRLVDQLVSRAVNTPVHDTQLSRTLFELLIPNNLKEYAPDKRNMVMMLDDDSAVYPWELLQDGGDPKAKPLSVTASMIRQLVMKEFRVQPVLAQEHSALVIGDPEGSKDTSVFPTLMGARDEAHNVTRLLNARGYSPVVELIGDKADATTVLGKLYDRPYQILHIAAHGVFEQPVDKNGRPLFNTNGNDATTPQAACTVSGVVLGDGMYLTPVEIDKMRVVPQLVFVNCCHLARQAAGQTSHRKVEYHKLAAGFARQLMDMGVRAVIAAGWAVDDGPAATFAGVFYQAMLDGEGFGQAVLSARQRVFEDARRTGSNTWGAYQCYGDPEFVLDPRAENKYVSSVNGPVSASELRQEVESIGAKIEYSSQEEREKLLAKFNALLSNIPDAWMDYGSVCTAIAGVRSRFGDYDAAAEIYTRAKTGDRGDVSLAALEQLVSMTARSVVKQCKSASLDRAGKRAEIARLVEANKIIENLLALHPSSERWSLKGGMHKRWVIVASKGEQVKQLREMADSYRHAYDMASATKSSDMFYPLQNLIAAEIALGWCQGSEKKGKSTRKQLDSLIRELASFMTSSARNSNNFWTMSQEPDYRLLTSLDNRVLNRDEERWITSAYLRAQRRGGSPGALNSVIEHTGFFLFVASEQLPKGKVRDELCAALERLIGGLESE